MSKRAHDRGIELSIKYNGNLPQDSPFPSIAECINMSAYNKMLAVTFFAQAFNTGYEDEGAAAKNTKKFIDCHLGEVLQSIFESQSEIDIFSKFKDEILDARNQMIVHADARCFDIKHEDNGFLTQKMHVNAVKNIDTDYWLKIIDPLWSAILKYMSKYQTISA